MDTGSIDKTNSYVKEEMVTATQIDRDVTRIYDKTVRSTAKTVINVGGARSSKSYSIAQLVVEKLINSTRCSIGVCRKTFPALRMTAYKLIIDLLTEYGQYNPDNHNKTEHVYRHRDSFIQFFSLDEVEKIKSTGFNYIWMEEANEFTYEDYIVLKLRLSEPTTTKNQMYLTLNPIDEQNWIAQKLILEDDVQVIKSTYRDNPFLSREYVKILTDLIDQDANYYRIYTLGEWGKLEHLIYKDYQVVDAMPQEYQAMVYGLDFGFVNPTALIKVAIVNREIYLEERIYKSGLTNSQLIELLSHEARGDIYADSAEPARIVEIQNAGHNIFPANKDVKLGIDLCQRQKLNIVKDSVNLIKEMKGYQRHVDRNGNVSEEPVKFNDHLMDSMRYGVFGLVDRFGYATQRPIKAGSQIHSFRKGG